MTHHLKRAILFVGASEKRAAITVAVATWLLITVAWFGMYRQHYPMDDPASLLTIFLGCVSATGGLIGAGFLLIEAPFALVRLAKHLEGNWK